jgi:hypothetical protein
VPVRLYICDIEGIVLIYVRNFISFFFSFSKMTVKHTDFLGTGFGVLSTGKEDLRVSL